MKTRHPFQFNASPVIPSAWQRTMMDVVELCNSQFRSFYKLAVESIIENARATGCTHVVELAAGNAPISRRLLKDPRADGLKFTVCDYLPKPEIYRRLHSQSPSRVTALEEPVDFTQPRDWESGTTLVLAAAFHHVHSNRRPAVVQLLANSADSVMILAPIRKTVGAILTAFASPIPAFLLPYFMLNRPGRLRRSLWCTLCPIVPLMMLWDGVGGCLRQWSKEDWLRAAETIDLPRRLIIRETATTQTVIC